ncbi:MAG: hypothetical protein WC291_04300 [Thermodesulfovibrionales bacterium]|jgi:hypothetical protein
MIGLKSGMQKDAYSYVNDFLYFVLKPDETRGPGSLIYCSGVNITRFLPSQGDGTAWAQIRPSVGFSS